jgi:hypothetical protein
MRWYTVLAGVLVSLALVACGGGSNAEETVREIAEGFVQALSDDPPKAYTYLAQDCKDSIDFLEFATGLAFIGGFVGESEIKVKNVEVLDRGDKEMEAKYEVVLVSDGEEIPLEVDLDSDAPTHFVKEDGRWRFGDCAGFGGQEEFGEADVPVPAPAPPEPVESPAVRAEADDDSTLPGQYVDLPVLYGGPYPDTAQHVNEDVDYRAQGLPPTGGPHWGSSRCGDDPEAAPAFCGPVAPGFYLEPWDAESLVHTMEHTGVVVWYNSTDEDVIDELQRFAGQNSERFLVVTPFPEMQEETIAITAWSRRDEFSASDYTRGRLQRFLNAHECRFDPEGFC